MQALGNHRCEACALTAPGLVQKLFEQARATAGAPGVGSHDEEGEGDVAIPVEQPGPQQGDAQGSASGGVPADDHQVLAECLLGAPATNPFLYLNQ